GFGIAIALGNILGGKVADRRPVRALIVMFALQAAVLAAFTFTVVSPALTLVTLAAMGVLTFSTVPGLQLYVVELARRHAPS
ncbi:MFS sugar transporter, partial [Acinetobacter baumannii]